MIRSNQFNFFPRIKQYLEKKASSGKRLAIVLDIDDTAIWSANARPVMPIKKIYDLAIKLGISVFFVTARIRNADNSRFTLNQLRNTGYPKFKQLYMMPIQYARANAIGLFKQQARKQISQKYQIILNAGDQWTDLTSNPNINMPNIFYLIPNTADGILLKLKSQY